MNVKSKGRINIERIEGNKFGKKYRNNVRNKEIKCRKSRCLRGKRNNKC